MDIHHVDGNPRNNDPANLRLLCRSCNVALSNRARSRKNPPSVLCVSVCEREEREGRPGTPITKEDCEYRQASPEMQANSLYEAPFRTWLLHKIGTDGADDRTTAIAEGAELVGCSPTTTARYITKLTSPSGPLAETTDALGYRILLLKEHLHP